MSNEFTASNGVKVRQHPVSKIEVRYRPGEWASPGQASGGFTPNSAVGVAVFEYLRHLEDERLGRWRSTKSPEWTAVVKDSNIVFTSDQGDSFKLPANQSATAYRAHLNNDRRLAIALEYRESFPQRPWERALPGEVWEITADMHINKSLNKPQMATVEHEPLGSSTITPIRFRITETGYTFNVSSSLIIAGTPLHTRKK